MTVVFPVPAPAATRVTSSSVTTASACSCVSARYPSLTAAFFASLAWDSTNRWLASPRRVSSVTTASVATMWASNLLVSGFSLATSCGVQREVTVWSRGAAVAACDFLTNLP